MVVTAILPPRPWFMILLILHRPSLQDAGMQLGYTTYMLYLCKVLTSTGSVELIPTSSFFGTLSHASFFFENNFAVSP